MGSLTTTMSMQAAAAGVGLCAQMKALQAALGDNTAMVFNLAKCAESEGRFADAANLLTEYIKNAPRAADLDEVRARLVVLKSLSSLPDPQGSLVRVSYASAAKHIQTRSYDQAIAEYQKAERRDAGVYGKQTPVGEPPGGSRAR